MTKELGMFLMILLFYLWLNAVETIELGEKPRSDNNEKGEYDPYQHRNVEHPTS